MNAVKNCLVVLVAAAGLASCSADPTKDLAGKDLTIVVTPTAVAARANDTVEVFASALDPLGGAANGVFTLSGNTGPNFTASIDSNYNPVYAGDRPQGRTRIVIVTINTANDSFTVSGTGGSRVVQVRIAPDSTSPGMSFTSADVPLQGADTISAPPGIRFTHGTAISFHTPGQIPSVVVGMSSDSTTMYFRPGPGAAGRATITGLANVTTPTLTYAATTSVTDTINVPAVDSFPATHSSAVLTTGQIDTITAGAGWTFTASSTVTKGVVNSLVLGFSADSSQMYVIPAPAHDTTGEPTTVSGLKFPPYTSTFSLPTSQGVTRPAAGDLGDDGGTNPLTAPVFHYTMPAGQLVTAIVDTLTFGTEADDPAVQFTPIGDGAEQWYKVTFTDAGPVKLTADWTGGGDLDMFVFLVNGAGTSAAFKSQAGATSSHPEVDGSQTAAANSTYLVDITNSSGDVAGWLTLKISR